VVGESKTGSPVVEHCRIIAPMHWIAASRKDAANREVRCLRRKVLPVRQSRRLCRVVAIRQIQNLRRTRDLLLPRLLSGQVELKTGAA
jgi:hypothetical protein